MSSNSGMVLAGIGRELLGVSKAADALSGKLNAVKVAALGAMAAIAGTATLTVLGKIIKAGDKLVEQQTKLKGLGVSDATVGRATRAAYDYAQAIPGTNPAGNLATIREARGILNNTQEAIAAAPAILRTELDLGVYNDNQRKGDILSLIKALDIKGGFIKNGELDVATLNRSMREAEAALVLTNGILTGKQFYQFTRMAGPAATAMNTEQYLKDTTEAQMGLGSTGGRGMQMAAKTFLGGQLTKASRDQLIQLGLLSEADVKSDHGHYSIKPGTIKGFNELMNKGMIRWFHDVVVPAMEAHHFTGPAAVLQALSALPVTEQRLFSFIYTNWAQVEKFGAQFDKQMGVDTNATLQKGSPALALRDFHAAWDGLMQALGAPVVSQSIAMLHGLTDAILFLEGEASRHPTAVKVIYDLTAALAGLMVIGGGLAIAGAALSPFAKGLRGLSSALSLFTKGAAAEEGLVLLGAGAGTVGSLAAFAVGLGEVVAAIAAAKYVFSGWSSMNQGQPSTTGLKNPHALPTIGSTTAPDRGLPRVLPHGFYFGAMPPPPSRPSAVPPPANSNRASNAGTAANPLHVHVDNGRDLADGVIDHAGRQLSRPAQGSATGTDPTVLAVPMFGGGY